MSERVPGVFHTTFQKSLQWVHEIERESGWHDQRAYRALRATLHALRDRMTVDQAAHLGAQLPMLVRGFYYEGWHPATTPRRDISNWQAFTDAIRKEASDPQLDAEKAAAIVFSVMAAHLGEEEMRKVIEHLPKQIARTMRQNGFALKGAAATAGPQEPRRGDSAPDFIAGTQSVWPSGGLADENR